ncbi:tetratricopeptide repeat protein [Pseudobythopirellula maris]|uniref:tetratricopeptide repeat protein n=1 Tax=Pseudobythopirellula maris TaxID=2527991 RepID=UPI0018D31043|nr:hypothetical protein [Pseudobythopirellula maris]
MERSTQTPGVAGGGKDVYGIGSLPTAVQHRLVQVQEHAKRSFEKGDHEYAHALFAQCVAEAPCSLVFLQHFRANLTARAKTQKKSSGFSSLRGMSSGGRSAIAKAASKGEWLEAFRLGCESLRKSIDDTGALTALADACGELGHVECQLYYLRWALDVAPADDEVNRRAAAALEANGHFEQAIGCWRRVLQRKPHDEEARRAVSRLSVEQTIDEGGYNPQLLGPNGATGDIVPPRVASRARPGDQPAETPVERLDEPTLRDAIDAAPTDHVAYLDLANLFYAEGRLHDAERLLARCLKRMEGTEEQHLVVRDRLETTHLERLRRALDEANRKKQTDQTRASTELAAEALEAFNQADLEVHAARVKREPGNPRRQYELALRLKRVGKRREAITAFQAARADKSRVAEVQIHLGECFQHIEQFKLAMSSYEAAIRASENGDPEVRKLGLFRAGVLAMGLKDLETAEKWLTELAAIDFSYRNVGERLDKIAQLRHKK